MADILAGLLGRGKRKRVSAPSRLSSQGPKSSSGSAKAFLFDLPPELIRTILSHLPVVDLVRVSLTCRRLNQEVRDQEVIKSPILDLSSSLNPLAFTDSNLRHVVSFVGVDLQKIMLTKCLALTDNSWDILFPFCRAGSLTTLSIRGCSQLRCPDILAFLTPSRLSLKSLDLSLNGHITPTTISALCCLCQNLESLAVAKCPQVSDQCVSILLFFTNIRSLNLEGCRWITDAAFSPANLQSWTLPSISPQDPEQPIGQKSFKEYKTALASSSIVLVPRTVGLAQLNISSCTQVSEMGLARLMLAQTQRPCPLESLNVSLCNSMDLTTVAHEICECFPFLEKLNAANCKLNFGGVRTLLCLGHLKEINFSGCGGVSGNVFDLPKRQYYDWASQEEQPNPNTSRLDVSGCYNLSDTGLVDIARRFPSIEHLNVAECSRITGHGLAAFVEMCPKLESLNVTGLIHLATKDVNNLVKRSPSLRRIVGERLEFVEEGLLSRVNHSLQCR
eukprot:c15490_g1_i1.p1 GENE.c15490_g1_i1~~c15490_g1_i1.p1  ORF type:complete len:504 (+),score=74.92 c15490_g1_i1:46-1557(+)